MDRLASCYFCGAAADTEITDYPVIPRELAPEDGQQGMVALCPSCREKLAQILDPIVATIDQAGDSTGDAAQSESPPRLEVSPREEPDTDASEDDGPGGGDAPVVSEEAEEASSDIDSGLSIDDVSVSKQEFHKVMRLLGNREFPVDRAAFEVVATNAYDVSSDQVDAILRVAVDQGLIAEDGDQLVRST